MTDGDGLMVVTGFDTQTHKATDHHASACSLSACSLGIVYNSIWSITLNIYLLCQVTIQSVPMSIVFFLYIMIVFVIV